MSSSRSRTWSWANSMSVPHGKRRVTSDWPSRDTLRIDPTPGAVESVSSIGSVTDRSTSIGPVSGIVVQMTRRGNAMSGRRDTGIRRSEIDPKRTTATKNIATATGRRTASRGSDMESFLPRLALGTGAPGGTVADLGRHVGSRNPHAGVVNEREVAPGQDQIARFDRGCRAIQDLDVP